MNRNYKLILITGLPRSGTTWVGEEFSKRFDADYIFEPFSVKYHPTFDNSLHLRNIISNFLDDAYHQYGWNYPTDFLINDQESLLLHVDKLRDYYNMNNSVLIIKQPLTVKLGWVLSALSPDHVYWIDRHPGGIYNSFKQRNVLKKWTEKEFSVFKKSIYYSDKNIGTKYFKGLKHSTQYFYTLFHEGRKIAFEALTDFGNYNVISYESACRNINKELDFNNPFLKRKKEVSTMDEKYKKNKSHLNTNQDSNYKELSWRKDLSKNLQKAMFSYFENENLANYEFPIGSKRYFFSSIINRLKYKFKNSR